MRALAFLTLLAVLCIGGVAGLSITNSVVFRGRLDLGSGGGQYEVAQFIVDFDEDLYVLNSTSKTLVPLVSLTGTLPNSSGDNDRIPVLWSMGLGMFGLRCATGKSFEQKMFISPTSITRTTLEAISSALLNGPPTQLLPSVPSDEPLATIMGALGGIPLPGDVPKKKFSFVLLLNGQEDGKFGENIVGGLAGLASCQPSIVFNTAGLLPSMKIADSTGNVFSGSTVPTFTQANCTFQDAGVFYEQLRYFLNTAANVSSANDLRRMDKMIASFTSRKAFTACQAYLYSFLTLVNDTYTVQGSNECFVSREDRTYASNPCCNQTLSFMSDKCCTKAASVQVPYTRVDSVLSPKVAAQCANPGLLQPLLRAFVDAVTADKDQGTTDYNSMYDGFRRAIDSCYSETRWGGSCKTDADCPWPPNTCLLDNSGNNGRCNVNVLDPFPAFAACLLTRLDQSVAREALDIWGVGATVKAVFDNTTNGGTDFIKPFIGPTADYLRASPYAVEDCVSDRDTPFARKIQFQCQPGTAQCSLVVVPANQTGCLSVKQCAYQAPGFFYDPSKPVDEAACTGRKPASYAALCQGTMCQEVTVLPKCRLNGPNFWISDQTACTNAGGFWTKDFNSQLNYCSAINPDTNATPSED